MDEQDSPDIACSDCHIKASTADVTGADVFLQPQAMLVIQGGWVGGPHWSHACCGARSSHGEGSAGARCG